MQIDQGVFIVSGGASGLGAATVRMLAAAGGRVVIADVSEDQGAKLAAELGGNARFVRTEVTEEASAQAAVDLAVEQFGRLNGLVNCAGIGVGGRVLGREKPHDLALFSRTIAVNLIGSFNMLRLTAEKVRRAAPNADGERGVIINAASIAAFDGQIGQAAYAASKAGIVGMTLPIARELAQFGIRVVTIAPGIFETPMLRSLPQEVQASLGRSIPFPPRLGRPEEYAALTRHIIENPMLNGEVIRLDGALRMTAE